MRNTQQIGCFGFLTICVAIYFLWVAILYAGIPVALIGGLAAYGIFRSHRHHDDGAATDMRYLAAVIGGGAAVLLVTSLLGNIFTEHSPLKRLLGMQPSNIVSGAGASSAEVIPAIYRGRWAANRDCGNDFSSVNIDEDSIDFVGDRNSFSAHRATSQTPRSITLVGNTIIVADTWADSGYQADTVQMKVVEEGEQIELGGRPFLRCGR